MPKIIAHALTGATILTAIAPREHLNKRTIFFGAVLAVSPDFDFAAEWLLNLPNVHRGISHSLMFSFLVGILLALLMPPAADRQKLAAGFSLAYLSHAFLDMVTSTSGGVKLFYPVSEDYYHFAITDLIELPFGPAPDAVLTWMFWETIIFLPLFSVVLLMKRSREVNS